MINQIYNLSLNQSLLLDNSIYGNGINEIDFINMFCNNIYYEFSSLIIIGFCISLIISILALFKKENYKKIFEFYFNFYSTLFFSWVFIKIILINKIIDYQYLKNGLIVISLIIMIILIIKNKENIKNILKRIDKK